MNTRSVRKWVIAGAAVLGCAAIAAGVASAGNTLQTPTVGLCNALGDSAREIATARDAGVPASNLIARIAAVPIHDEALKELNYSMIGTIYSSTLTADEASDAVVTSCLKRSAR